MPARIGLFLTLAGSVASLAASHPATGWHYSSAPDLVRDRPDHLACVLSQNSVRLGFPYRSQRLRLCLRRQEKTGLNVYVDLPAGGQFSCGADHCDVDLRFDQNEPQSFMANTADDGSNDVLFLDEERSVANRILAAHRLIVEAVFYRAGTQDLVFDVRGLDWPKEDVPQPIAAPAPAPMPPAPVLRHGVRLDDGEFVRAPSGDDVAAYYPDRAQRMGQDGTAAIACRVTTQGSLTDCTIVSEEPAGFGFGASALKMAHIYKLRPEAGIADGTVDVAFKLPGG